MHAAPWSALSAVESTAGGGYQATTPRVLGNAVTVVALLASPADARAEPLADVSITYAAPDGCPGVEDFRQELGARLVDTSPEAWHGFAFWVSVQAADAGYVARLRVIDPKGSDIDREVSDPQCREVVRAVAFVAAVLVDPNAASSPPAPVAETPPSSGALPPVPPSAAAPPPPPVAQPAPASVAPRPPPPPPPAATWEPTGWTGLATLGLTAHGAVADGVMLGPRFGLGVRYGDGWGAAGHLSVTRAQSGTVDREIGRAKLTWMAARTDLCLAFRPYQRVGLLPCLLLEVGQLRGEGTVGDSRTDQAARWLAPGGLGRAVVRLVDPLGAYLEVGAVAPIIKPRFYFSAPDGQETVHRVPGQGLFAGIGLALEFP